MPRKLGTVLLIVLFLGACLAAGLEIRRVVRWYREQNARATQPEPPSPDAGVVDREADPPPASIENPIEGRPSAAPDRAAPIEPTRPEDRPAHVQASLDALRNRLRAAMETRRQLPALLEDSREFAAEHPGDQEIQLHLSLVLLQLGRLREAEAVIRHAIQLAPMDAALQIHAGTIAMQLQRTSDAITHYHRAAELRPDHPEPRLHLAAALMHQGEDAAAEAALRSALALESNQFDAHAKLANLLGMQGDYERALVHTQRAIDLAPDRPARFVYVRKKAAILRRAGRPLEAIQTLEAMPLQQSLDPTVVEELALAYYQLGEPGRAAEAYEKALGFDPTNWRLVAGAGEYRAEAGDLQTANTHLRTLRALDAPGSAIDELSQLIDRRLRETLDAAG